MYRVAASPVHKRELRDRIVYTLPLAALPGMGHHAAMVVVWHADGAIDTHFVPNIAILKQDGEVKE
jgi:hypothetical protein